MSHQTSIADSSLASHISRESAALSSAYMAHESTLIVPCSLAEGRKFLPNGSGRTKGGEFRGPDRCAHVHECRGPNALWLPARPPLDPPSPPPSGVIIHGLEKRFRAEDAGSAMCKQQQENMISIKEQLVR